MDEAQCHVTSLHLFKLNGISVKRCREYVTCTLSLLQNPYLHTLSVIPTSSFSFIRLLFHLILSFFCCHRVHFDSPCHPMYSNLCIITISYRTNLIHVHHDSSESTTDSVFVSEPSLLHEHL